MFKDEEFETLHTNANSYWGFSKWSGCFTGKNYFTVRKRALHYIYLRTLYVGFMVTVGV